MHVHTYVRTYVYLHVYSLSGFLNSMCGKGHESADVQRLPSAAGSGPAPEVHGLPNVSDLISVCYTLFISQQLWCKVQSRASV